MNNISAIVLTHNEEIHLERCLSSLVGLVSDVLVVDSFSSDQTAEIAEKFGAKVLRRAWVNYADQFNWALDQISSEVEWVLRIDADEFLTSSLIEEIQHKLGSVPTQVDGIFVSRRMIFQGRIIRFGGVFPVRVLRLFRHGRGHCEKRWMDEHVMVEGAVVDFSGELIDDNKNSLTWWTEKHNKYSSREVVDILNQEYRFMPSSSVAKLRGGRQAGFKRWIKEHLYSKMPFGLRALLYFLYRYVVRLGFLDGQAGAAFHILQAFWYRYLVDAKLQEVRRFMKTHDANVADAIQSVLGIDISKFHPE
jgi:glycosyltransferase involved in cell wall biosynthesis